MPRFTPGQYAPPPRPGSEDAVFQSCGTDLYRHQLIRNGYGFENRMEEQNARIHQFRHTAASGEPQKPAGTVYTIPVVIHAVYYGFSGPVPQAQILQAIQDLNDAFRNVNYYDPYTGADVEIEFCLARQDTNGNLIPGIFWISNALTNMTVETNDAALKALSYQNSNQYMNIWVVTSITSLMGGSGVAGYSSMPGAHGTALDGIVVEKDYFGTSPDKSTVLVHEAGHYLGLYHTFESSCANTDCALMGDRVCDTPPDSTLVTFTGFCTSSFNTCSTDEDDITVQNPFRPVALGGTGDQEDPARNYMDYGTQKCFTEFTEGQKERMRSFLTTTRSSLLTSAGCENPCTLGTTASFTLSADTILAGDLLIATNTSVAAAATVWKFNGIYSAASTGWDSVLTVPGTYRLRLVTTNGSQCVDSMEQGVVVLCPVPAGFTGPAGSEFLPGETAFFSSTSSAADSVHWMVDGSYFSTGNTLSYTFDRPGVYQIHTISYSATCTDTSDFDVYYNGMCNPHASDHWYTGFQAALQFTEGKPHFLFGSQMEAYEGSVSVSDAAGNLLFYCNGGTGPLNLSGAVWNRNHEVMPNGILDATSGCTSARNAALTVPRPGHPGQYYLFTNGCMEDSYASGFRYHIVDMAADGGLGDITLKNQLLSTLPDERVAATRHCNGKDYWIVAGERVSGLPPYNCKYQIYLATAAGVSLHGTHTVPGPHFAYLAGGFSPDGKYLAVAHDSLVILMEFDKATGAFSPPVFIPLPVAGSVEEVDFDTKSRYMYAAEIFSGSSASVFQFDLEAPSVAASGVKLATVVPNMASFGCGYNGSLYMSRHNSRHFSTIVHEHLPPSLNSVKLNNVSLGYGTGSFGLPEFVPNFFDDPGLLIHGYDSLCFTVTHEFLLDRTPCVNGELSWVIKGSAAIVSSTDTSVTITMSAPGWDTLIAVDDGYCQVYTDTLIFKAINHPPSAAWSFVQSGDTFTFSHFTSMPSTSCFWDFGDGTTSTDCSPVHVYSGPGSWTACLTVSNDCGSDTSCQSLVIVSGDPAQIPQFSIFPNPAQDRVTVHFGQMFTGEISVVDAAGRIVLETKADAQQELLLDTSELPDGLYFIKVRSEHNRFTGKVMLLR